MKVKFNEAVGGPHISVGTGGVIDLPRSDAEYWIRIGLAELVEEKEEPRQRPVTVQQVRKKVTRPVK